MKRLFKWGLTGIVLLLVVIFGAYYWVEYSVQGQWTKKVEELQPQHAVMVLGTSRWLKGGGENLFFKYRMKATEEIISEGKAKYALVSGDNSIKEYNETKEMRKALNQLGISDSLIVDDFAGFSTLDSVVRTREVFGQDSIIIVSQPYHLKRALFIANHYGIKAQGLAAKEIAFRYAPKSYLREYLARVKCVIDVYLLHRMPKYYKEKEIFPR